MISNIKSKEVRVEVSGNMPSVREEMEIYTMMQGAYERISELKELQAVIDILSVNLLEHKDRKIYKDKYTVFEVTQRVYDNLLAGNDSDEVR